MEQSSTDNIVQLARMSKGRGWLNEAQKDLRHSVLHVYNARKLVEVQNESALHQSQLDDLKVQLQKNQGQLQTYPQLLATLEQTQLVETEKVNAMRQTVEDISGRYKDIEQQLNTFYNGHAARQTKLETRFDEFMKSQREADMENSRRLDRVETNVEDLMKLRNERISQFLDLIDSPEKLGHLRQPLLRQDALPTPGKLATDFFCILTYMVKESSYNRFDGAQQRPRSCSFSQDLAGSTSPTQSLTACTTPPAYLQQWVDKWNTFKDLFNNRRPNDEPEFIRSFLASNRDETAKTLQTTILQYCHTAERLANRPHGRYGVRLFLDTKSFTWQDVLDALEHLDYRKLSQALRVDRRHKRAQKKG